MNKAETTKSYAGLHKRVVAKRGKPSKCSKCGTTTAKRFEWASMTGDYLNIDDYIRLCTKCHLFMDGRHKNLVGYGKKFKIRNCIACKRRYRPNTPNQSLCGSVKNKKGCSYEKYWFCQLQRYHINKIK